jgi:hypothetical protein
MIVRIRLPDTAVRHYLRPSPDRAVPGRVLVAPVRREELVPAALVLASSRDVDLVELPVQAGPGDMAQGLRPGDRVQVLAAFTEGARRGRAVVLLPSAEAVQVLEDRSGLTGAGQERGVQLRMPSDRAPIVAAAIATARIFVVKAPGPATGQAAAEPVPPSQSPQPQPATSQPDSTPPESSQQLSQPNLSRPDPSQTDPSPPEPSQLEASRTGGSQASRGRAGAMRRVVAR